MDPRAEQITDTGADVAPAGSPELRGEPDWDVRASAAETEWQEAELAASAAVVRIANRRA